MKKSIKFQDLLSGDKFTDDLIEYVKMEALESQGYLFNAVDLFDGGPVYIEPDHIVIIYRSITNDR